MSTSLCLLDFHQPEFLSSWCHQMETFFVLLALCVGIHQLLVSNMKLWFFFDLHFNKSWVNNRDNGWVNNRDTGDLRHLPLEQVGHFLIIPVFVWELRYRAWDYQQFYYKIHNLKQIVKITNIWLIIYYICGHWTELLEASQKPTCFILDITRWIGA